MQSKVAVVTMVRDDYFFLKKWVDYYGQLFGRENLYVINHGHEAKVSEIASGCNLIGIPGDPHRNFDVKRWRLLNGLVAGLRSYYSYVICGDVDEFVVLDPASGSNLAEFMFDLKDRQVLTPFGLEVVHRRSLETDPLKDVILGPRRHVQIAMHYSKPCVVGATAKLSRGGHYSTHDKLEMPQDLYLLHLKFCDFDLFVEAQNRRNAMVADIGISNPKNVMVGKHWFTEARRDSETFDEFDAMPIIDRFDYSTARNKIYDSWHPRGKDGMWNFERYQDDNLSVLPDRFFGIL